MALLRQTPVLSRQRETKKPTGKGWFFQENWWSWRELNPRPQAFVGQIYMFSALI